MKKAIVLGASGGMGYALVKELVSRNIQVTAFAREEEKLVRLFKEEHGVTICRGDAFSIAALDDAVAGHDLIFHAINLPYANWETNLPMLTKNIIAVAEKHAAKLAIVDNIYSYGRQRGEKITESTEKNPHTKKGKLRLKMEKLYEQSDVPYVLAHFPDFYGPYVANSLLGYTLNNMVQHKKAQYVGDQRLAREHLYTPDGAKAFVNLALHDDAYGQHWNIPASDVITGEEMIQLIRQETNYSKKVKTVTKNMLRFVGLFDKQMREFVELQYLYEDPVILSGEKYEQLIGKLPKTSYEEGIKHTIETMK